MKLLFFLPLFLFSLDSRIPSAPLKISIIIPCHPDHFPLLEPLFLAYENQTSLPEEIVVSLSEAQKVPPTSLLALKNRPRPFAIQIITFSAPQSPGKNRNSACAAATGDLFICQDADDIPHPQRVEAIRYLFENFQIEHLIHQWIGPTASFPPLTIQGLENQCTKYRSYDQIDLPQIHNGSVAFLRPLFQKLHWKPLITIDEDTLFNRHAYALCANHYVLSLPLICYRSELSTFDLVLNKNS